MGTSALGTLTTFQSRQSGKAAKDLAGFLGKVQTT